MNARFSDSDGGTADPPASNLELERVLAAAGPDCDAVLLSSSSNVTYASGFAVPTPEGMLASVPFAGSFALISNDAPRSVLAVPATHQAQAATTSRLAGQLLTFDLFDSFRDTDPRRSYLDALDGAVTAVGLGDGTRLGIEARALPHACAEHLRSRLPGVVLIDVGPAVTAARRVKTPREIDLLRHAAAVADAGQHALDTALATELVATNEFELYAAVQAAIGVAAGLPVRVVGELVSGDRTCVVAFPAGPRDRLVAAGDPVLMDISQRVGAYWSDCCNTYIAGGRTPTPRLRRVAGLAQAVFDSAVSELRAGRRACDVWLRAARVYEDAGTAPPHYLGHQIGVDPNEEPRLVPYDTSELLPGMVFAVEPGAYDGEGGTGGVRFEKMLLVTDGDPVTLSTFEWGIRT